MKNGIKRKNIDIDRNEKRNKERQRERRKKTERLKQKRIQT